MKASFSGDVVACPACGNTLGVMNGGVLTVKKRGRVVRLTVWEEASIICEDCGTEFYLKCHDGNMPGTWNGRMDSRFK